ncbi:hypothetical protein [Bradyrhizobium japonicum]|uniref:hypothetical protein n=1 Tax=Bradyrhizobium japonicum TaxID=375 RepID=UPI001BA7E066|nr:hypothetical protein [Bradyrhizobium japonicum]MBR0962204.1 hypothetical protein [Bradyrhizobium japonicum]
MNVNDWAPWVAILIAAASFLHSFFNGRSKENEKRFAVLEERITDKVDDIKSGLEGKASKETVSIAVGKLDILEDRATRIESDLRHLPDHTTVNRLENLIGKLSGDVGVLSERIRPIASIADRLQEKILEQAGFDR